MLPAYYTPLHWREGGILVHSAASEGGGAGEGDQTAPLQGVFDSTASEGGHRGGGGYLRASLHSPCRLGMGDISGYVGGGDMCVVCLDPIQKPPVTERAGPQSLHWVAALRPPPLGVPTMGYAERRWDMEGS